MPKLRLDSDPAKIDKVIRRLTGTEEATGKFATLPNASSLFESTENMQAAINAMQSAWELKGVIDKAKSEQDKLKEEITAMVIGADVPGYRHGNIGVAVTLQSQTRLDKNKLRELLIDNGVDSSIVGMCIAQAHVTGDPFYKVDFRSIG